VCKTLPTWAVDARAHAFGPLGVEEVGVELCECLFGLGGVDPPLPLVQPASRALATDTAVSETVSQRRRTTRPLTSRPELTSRFLHPGLLRLARCNLRGPNGSRTRSRCPRRLRHALARPWALL
jgi:hypothetical protein